MSLSESFKFAEPIIILVGVVAYFGADYVAPRLGTRSRVGFTAVVVACTALLQRSRVHAATWQEVVTVAAIVVLVVTSIAFAIAWSIGRRRNRAPDA